VINFFYEFHHWIDELNVFFNKPYLVTERKRQILGEAVMASGAKQSLGFM